MNFNNPKIQVALIQLRSALIEDLADTVTGGSPPRSLNARKKSKGKASKTTKSGKPDKRFKAKKK